MAPERFRVGAELHPADDGERDAFLLSAGVLTRETCPEGFTAYAAVWARDRDLLVGQAALVLLVDDLARDRLAPAELPPGIAIGLIDALAVRVEYRETGLEERMVRHLCGGLMADRDGPGDALIYVGAARVPVMASVRAALPPVDRLLR
jgi:hypothetical protein